MKGTQEMVIGSKVEESNIGKQCIAIKRLVRLVHVLITMLIFFSQLSFSWTACSDDISKPAIVKEIESTPLVIFGRVTEGRYISSGRLGLEFIVSPYNVLKGTLNEKQLKIYTDYIRLLDNINIGENYVFFLKEDNNLDRCSVYINLSLSVTNMNMLHKESDRIENSRHKALLERALEGYEQTKKD